MYIHRWNREIFWKPRKTSPTIAAGPDFGPNTPKTATPLSRPNRPVCDDNRLGYPPWRGSFDCAL
jgi:hypothetical protein